MKCRDDRLHEEKYTKEVMERESGSGQRLSVEELKRLNQPPAPSAPAAPPDAPTGQNWDDLLAALTALYRLEKTNSDRLERLEASVGPQEALLRALGRPGWGSSPHRRPNWRRWAGDVAQMRAGAETGWEKERAAFFSAQAQTSPNCGLPDISWSSLLLGADSPGVDWGRAVGGLVQLGKTSGT